MVYKAVRELTPDPRNPRLHSPRQIRQIARSIETFGFNVPLLINSDGMVITGHGRLKACVALGWSKVPTICLDHLSASQARAFMIADNRLTDNSEWSDQLLAEQLSELSSLELDFDLEVTGFDTGEIDFRIESLSSRRPDETLERVPASVGPTVTRPGDLWLLGEHRVHCGNALEAGAFRTLMAGEQAQAIFSDPPYNVRIEGNVGGHGKVKHREFVMASGELSSTEFIDFLSKACSLLAQHSTEGSLHFICMDWRHVTEILAARPAAYSELENICVWVKDSPGMGSFYRSQHEFIFVFKHGRGRHHNNIQLGQYGRNRSNVWLSRSE